MRVMSLYDGFSLKAHGGALKDRVETESGDTQDLLTFCLFEPEFTEHVPYLLHFLQWELVSPDLKIVPFPIQ